MSGRIFTLEIDNFKSYKGHHVIGPFRDFQAICGPNGSGKSNLMDAISFVLGIRSTHLRGTQLRDLVYRPKYDAQAPADEAPDAKKRKKKGEEATLRASVKLVFETSDKEMIEFRRTIIDTASEYRIGTSVVTEKEYTERLLALNINARAKNFLVFQGDVGSLAGKSGVELTRHFEVISGSEELIPEYEAAKAEKDRAEETTIFTFHKKKGLGAERKQYRAMKEEADRFEALAAERAEAKRNLALVQLRHIAKGEVKLKGDAEKLKEEEEATKAKVAASERAMAEKKDSLATVSRKEADLRKKIRREQATVDKLGADAIHARETAGHAEASVAQNAAALAKLDAELRKRQAEVSGLRAQLADVERAKADFERAVAEEEKKAAAVALTSEQRARYAKVQDAARKQAAPVRADLDRAVRKQQQDEETRAALKRKVDEVAARRAQLEELRAKQQARKDKVTQFREEVASSLAEAKKQLGEIREQAGGDAKRREELERSLAQVEEQLKVLRLDRHEEEREARQKELLESLKRMFPQVRGRLLDLCKPIKQKYNIAVTVAMGKYMDAIVVDSDQTAMDCISFMKEQRAGVATFLPLGSLQVKPVDESVRKLGGGMRLALDVITSDEETQRMVQFAVGNTVVAETLEEARKLCFGGGKANRYRAVTLDGVLIEKSGLMTGGLSGIEQRAARWNEREAAEAKKRRDAIVRELEDVGRRQRKAATEDQLAAKVAADEERLRYCDVDLSAVEEKLAAIAGDAKAAAAEEEALKPELEAAERAVAEGDAKAAELRRKIDGVVGGLYRDFGNEIGVPNIREVEENRAQRAQEAGARRVEFEGTISKLKNQIEFENSRDIEGPRQRHERSAADAKERLARARAAEKDCKAQGDKATARLAELEKEAKELRSAAEEKETEIDQFKRVISSESQQARAIQKQIGSIESQLYRLGARKHDIIQRSRVEQLTLPVVSGKEVLDARDEEGEGEEAAQPTQEETEREAKVVFDFATLDADAKYEVKSLKQYEALVAALEERVKRLDEEMGKLAPNLKAVEQLDGVDKRLEVEKGEFEKARSASKTAAERFQAVRKERIRRFMTAFDAVSSVIDSTYKQLVKSAMTGIGGTAYLSLENEDEEPFLHGIKFSVMPPGKRFHDLEQLSGGEKTMAALALLFAIQKYHPAPFVVLDEIDAPLDVGNVAAVAKYLRDSSHGADSEKTQCIVISLKDTFFEKADALIGVAKDTAEHSSVIYTIDLPSETEDGAAK